MIKYKVDVLSELKKIGYTTYVAKTKRFINQRTLNDIKNGNANITLETLNKICVLLEIQPGDLIEYVETEEDSVKIKELNLRR